MTLLQQAPRLSTAAAADLARELYGLDAVASPLISERDQNFLLEVGSPPALPARYVLKIANATDDRALLEAQNAALAHVAHTGLCPQVLPAANGDAIVELPPRLGGRHLVRLLTWCPGVPMATVRRHSPMLLADLGRRLGELDRTLATFDHPAVHRSFLWDLAGGLPLVREHSGSIADEALRALVMSTADRFEREFAPVASKLRRSVIHNDANDHNVIVGGGDDLFTRNQRVVGVIDFGDIVHSFTVAELAIAVAYAMLDKPDPLAAAATMAGGYHAAHPLSGEEIAALFGLVCLRLAMSVVIAAQQMRERPDDEYLAISQESIQQILPVLAAIPPSAAQAAFRQACAKADTHAARRTLIGRNVKLGYRDPVTIVRGSMQYLYDEAGRRYIDAYNNVPHVGHCHPRVVEAAAEQMRMLNTNTRYLHDAVPRYAARLVATLPDPLRVCYFVNSGSEANELALRLARAHTKRRDLIVLDAAYHGHTTTLVSISPYKFNGPAGEGAPPGVHVVPIPDVYRGPHKNDDILAGRKYASSVQRAIDSVRAGGSDIGAFIAESAPSVGGQIIFPKGYLEAVYRAVRAAGGVCIADEVQTAYGRMGTHFYAFEAQHVVPDIVVLGKPIGNGHPIGAVVTTRDIAASFDNGMEFFSTFGGNTVSSAIGLVVLHVVQEEGLQEHARRVGDGLLGRLRGLVDRFPLVGDVRGSGLFIGVELVRSRETLEPAAGEASYVVNRMREEGILLGTDGPFENVIKIRPPMPFNDDDADVLVSTLERVLGEIRT